MKYDLYIRSSLLSKRRDMSTSGDKVRSFTIWPTINPIIRGRDKLAYMIEISHGFDKMSAALDDDYASISFPDEDISIPSEEEWWRRYCQSKDIEKEYIDDTLLKQLVVDSDLPDDIFSSLVAHDPIIRYNMLRSAIAKRCKWRQMSIREIRGKLNYGWLDLDTGFIADQPTGDYIDNDLAICSDSQVLLRTVADKLKTFDERLYQRYFFVYTRSYTGWSVHGKSGGLASLYYCPETGQMTTDNTLHVDKYFRLASNDRAIFDTCVDKLKRDLPLGIHTINVTRELIHVYYSDCPYEHRLHIRGDSDTSNSKTRSGKFRKSAVMPYFYDLDERRKTKYPPRHVYMYKPYRIFSRDKEFLRRVVRFYRSHYFSSSLFKWREPRPIYQFLTVLFIFM